MIIPPASFRIFLATEPIDFRKGMDGLVAHIANNFEFDPFDGAIWIFRSRRADRLKLIVWDGTGLVLLVKRLDGKRFFWPKPQSGPISLNKLQYEALLGGIDWKTVAVSQVRKPVFV